MVIKTHKIKEATLNIAGEILEKDLTNAISSKLLEYGKKAKIEGFRPGNIPENILQDRFGLQARQEAITDLINEEFQLFLKDKEIKLYDRPDFKLEVSKKSSKIGYTLTAPVLPSLDKLTPLAKLTLTEYKTTATEEDILESLKKIAKSQSTFEVEKEDRAMKKGDIAVIDYVGYMQNEEGSREAFKGGEGKEFYLELGSNHFITGFEEALIGKKKGEHLLKLKFPKDYQSKELSGKSVEFEVLVKEIKIQKPAEINDEWAKSLKRKDLADLKEYVKDLLSKHYDGHSKTLMKEELLNILATKTKVELPKMLLEKEATVIKEGQPEIEEKELQKTSHRRVLLGLLVSYYAESFKIKIEEDDVQKAIMSEAVKYPGQEEKVFKTYKENPDALKQLHIMIYEDKTLTAMIESCSKKTSKITSKDLLDKQPKK
ncbi:MAG: trigger factor [Alphaproteobacteria bacterium]|nr:trigger factor [Alphaproteobacteria bacterium]